MKLNFSLKTSVVLLGSALLSSNIYAACSANVDLGSNNIINVGLITANGAVTGGSITTKGAITGGSITDGTATMKGGSLTGVKDLTATGAITGGSIATTGAITGGSITATVAITGGSITDGTATMSGGNLTGVKNLTASGTLNVTGRTTINSASSGSYNLPNYRGGSNQTLHTNGSGTAYWGDKALTTHIPTCNGGATNYNVGSYKSVTIATDWDAHIVTTKGTNSGTGITIASTKKDRISNGTTPPTLANVYDATVSIAYGHVYVRCGTSLASSIRVTF